MVDLENLAAAADAKQFLHVAPCGSCTAEDDFAQRSSSSRGFAARSSWTERFDVHVLCFMQIMVSRVRCFHVAKKSVQYDVFDVFDVFCFDNFCSFSLCALS